MRYPLHSFKHVALAAAVGLGLLAASQAPAHAQKVAVFVNGEPITVLDVDQRIKLTEISTHKAPSRQEALNELIDEKLKIQIGKRYGFEIPDKDIENAFNGMARRMNQTGKQFTEGLSKVGVNVPALKRRIKADLTWNGIIRGKFPSINDVGERDVLTALEKKGEEKGSQLFQYTLRAILFIVPRGSAPAAVEARKREAEGLRNRFTDCQEGIAFARALTDVAVRDPVNKISTDFSAAQREALDATTIGRLTAPEVTLQGVEMFAVCDKKPTRGDTVQMAQTRDSLVGERYNERAKRYLEQLRREAIIEEPR